MAFQGALATIESFRNRLGITADTLSAQEILTVTALLEDTSGMIERASGRRLRRRHSATEYFPGGDPLIRTSMTHIAKIHSIRESYTRDFDDSDKYDELVEGTDYVIETGAGGETPGESGILRRLNGTWMGSQSSPGQVQVVYTAGFKTEQETALENTSVTIHAADDILDYSILSINDVAQSYQDQAAEDIALAPTATTARQAFVRFDVENVILPIWHLVAADLRLAGKVASGTFRANIYSMPEDPRLQGNIALLEAARSSGVKLGEPLYSSTSYVASTTEMDGDGDWLTAAATMAKTIADGGHISFAILLTYDSNPSLPDAHIASSENANSAMRPMLTIQHGQIFNDAFNVPQDLRNACLLQTVHEYQTRRSPGFKTQSARGVAIASGASYSKDLAGLLPEVLAVAKSYRRFV